MLVSARCAAAASARSVIVIGAAVVLAAASTGSARLRRRQEHSSTESGATQVSASTTRPNCGASSSVCDQAGLSGSNAIHLPCGIKVASAAAGPLAPPASSLMLWLLWLLLICFFPAPGGAAAPSATISGVRFAADADFDLAYEQRPITAEHEI